VSDSGPSPAPNSAGQSSDRLSRVLSLFARVEAGEGPTVLLLTANLFLLLTAYYMIKIVRETLILVEGGGAAGKIFTAAGQTLLLIPVIMAFSKLVERFDRVKLITYVTLFFVSNLGIFYLLGRMGVPVAVPFFIWVGIFNNTVISQSWAFANDLYTRDQGERLFPIVAIGSASGAVAGAALVGQLGKLFGKGNVEAWMLVAATILVFCVWLIRLADRRERDRQVAVSERSQPAEQAMGKEGAFRLVFGQRYLLLIASMIFVLNWVNTTGEFLLDRLVEDAAKEAGRLATLAGESASAAAIAYVQQFKASFFTWVNLIGMAMQAFVVSRVFKFLGVRVAVLVLPFVALSGYLVLAAIPLLSVVRIAKTAENSLDYSLQNTVRQALFLVTTREEKYKAKVAIDTLVVRVGDVAAAGLVALGMAMKFGTLAFVYVAIGLAVCWLVLSFRIGVHYRARVEVSAAP
jgi:AAA family ATP:ADP antiporter